MGAPEPSTGHVRLLGLTKRFGQAVAVDDVSLEVPRGSFTTFLGPSGCGKTTTLRMIAGFYDPDAGEIFIGGRLINPVPAHLRNIAMVFQDYALFPHMSVFDNVAYGPKLRGLARDEIRSRVLHTLEFLGLENLGRRHPNQLSGGQQQRVALARALVLEPEVLLLDEPLSNLDAKARVSIRNELIGIQRHLGLTTIYVTHDQEEALAMSDWIAVMNGGRVVQWGTPWEIYYRPRTSFMADFVGQVNLVEAEVVVASEGGLSIAVDGQGAELPAKGSPFTAGRALLCIRPEAVRIGPLGQGLAGALNLDGTVMRHIFLGSLMRYWVNVGGREWVVDLHDPGAHTTLDGAVTLSIDPARAHLIAEDDLPRRTPTTLIESAATQPVRPD